MNEIERQAQELEEMLNDQDRSRLSEHLDPGMAEFARKLALTESIPEENSAQNSARARVWQRVLNNADAASKRPSGSWQTENSQQPRNVYASPSSGLARMFSRPWLRTGFAAAAVLLVAFVGLSIWAAQPPPVSAQEIIQKARVAATLPARQGVSSFILVKVQHWPVDPRLRTERGLKGDEQITSRTTRWYQAPNRWRSEFTQKIVAADGKEVGHFASIQVSDGTDVWQYDPDQNTVLVDRFDPRMSLQDQVSPFGQAVANLSTLFEQASTCFDPKVTGRATVAGRATYVIDLGPTKCPSASVPTMNGREIIWVDQETFFVLKREMHAPDTNTVLTSDEVTSVEYNIAIDPARLNFTPPARALVTDNRPKPTPTADQYQKQLTELARQSDFPLLAPGYVTPNLTPLQPRVDAGLGNQVQLSYVPPDQAGTSAMAGPDGLSIDELKATYDLIARWTEGAEPTQIGAVQGWLRRGVRNADGTGSNSVALVVRDGTLVSVSSFRATPEELLKIAQSLQIVPGSHAPLPNPAPPSLAEIRARVSFPVWIPNYVPSGLTPEPPVGGSQPGENVEIKFHRADGGLGLTLLNGSTGCCLDADGRKTGQTVTVANRITAHFLDVQPQFGGPILWWQQDGAFVAISGPDMTRAELVKIAASMSKTDELGQTEIPAVRLSPTPLPAPSFKVLRPEWLPEQMKVFEQFDGSTVTLGFDPYPDADQNLHPRMTLMETPKSLSGGGSSDPQSTQEKIGPYQVTIIHRGKECTMMEWQTDDLSLMLSNVYDPPGHLRYSCEQLLKLVESIH